MTHRCSKEDGSHQWGEMFKKVRCPTRPTQARQDALIHGQGRSLFDVRSVLSVREHGKRATCLREAASAGMEQLACQP
jgi:hypothetical protein